MRVLVDTSVWSEALRRARKGESDVVREFRNLILEHRVDIIGPIDAQIHLAVQDQHQVRALLQRTVGENEIAAWVDGPLARSWGVQAAARIYHIIQTGYDGRVKRTSSSPPHQQHLSSERQIPGIPALGTRRELVDAGILTNDLVGL